MSASELTPIQQRARGLFLATTPEPETIARPDETVPVFVTRGHACALLQRLGWTIRLTEGGTFVSATAPGGRPYHALDKALGAAIEGR